MTDTIPAPAERDTGSMRVAPTHGDAEGPRATQGVGAPAFGSSDEISLLRGQVEALQDLIVTHEICSDRLTRRAEAAETRVRVLEEALRPFADEASEWDKTSTGEPFRDADVAYESVFLVRNLRRARAALISSKDVETSDGR